MDPFLVGALALGALFVLLAIGLPVGVAMGGIGILGIASTVGWRFALPTVQTLPYGFSASYVWTALPLFVLMGNLAAESGVTVDLFRGANHLLRRVRGGMYLAVIASSAMFCAISGSTVANAVVFTRLALPEMIRLGYSRSLSLGCICSSATFAALIPPSLTMVLIALLTDQSIGRLLIAGIVPGIASAIIHAAAVIGLVRWRPDLAPTQMEETDADRREGRRAILRSWPAVALFLLVLGGLYRGWFAPTSAGAVGAFGALLLAFSRRGPTGGWMIKALTETAAITSSILMVLIGGLFFSRFLVVTGTVSAVTDLAASATSQPILLAGLVVFYLLLGMVLDTASIMIVTLPIVFPVTVQAGIEPLWFSVLFAKLIEVAVFSPPIGINLFATLTAAGPDGDWKSLCRGIVPFLIAELVSLALLIAFPSLSTWLPARMLG